MSIIIPADIPVAKILSSEGYMVNPADSPASLHIGLINLMPHKEETELDFMRLIAPYPVPVKLSLITMASHQSRHTSAEHLRKFYIKSTEIDLNDYDGVIVTGAPLEFVAMNDIDYIDEIKSIFDALHTIGKPALYICWAAFAAAYYLYNVPFYLTDIKISGIFSHTIINKETPLLKNLSDGFRLPHSRFAYWKTDSISSAISIAATSQSAGICMLTNDSQNEYFINGHGEYRLETLGNEYKRDKNKGLEPHIPCNYFPHDDPSNPPTDSWHENGIRIMHNWLGIINKKR
ncbi:MAG: homoserine O-succinyltransferase [Paramuribaculum sp.]|nr:homoserine O-succinyltransferase [Paramuribaculum sp.]